jgi:2,4-dienoyl-CoA reductase-like NADH-dependent reductase (Old Yellow Enzyme family)
METAARTNSGASTAADFSALLSPITIGGVQIKNRIAVAPMQDYMSGPSGEITEQCLAYIGARAKGGAGLVISGVFLGTQLAARFPVGRTRVLFHPGHQLGASLYAERVHYFGAVACAQLSPGSGRQATPYDPNELVPAPTGGLPYEMTREKAFDALASAFRSDTRGRMLAVGPLTREMTIAEIASERLEFANSCQLAILSGFDMIEIHAAHGFLAHEFLSPFSNKRTDMYGGEWRNRKRFLNELVEAVRYACQGVPLGVRISAEEHMEGGLIREEMVDLAQDLEARGVDYIHLSDGGGLEESGHQIPDADRAEHMGDHGMEFKRALKIPVFVMAQHDPVKANRDIANGKYDVSALGRQLLCDPEYPNKLANGQPDTIVKCNHCDICLMRGVAGMYLACPLNPHLGREYLLDEYKIGPWKQGESIIPSSLLKARLPALYKTPWWKPEIEVPEKSWRPFRGPGPR